MGRFQKLVSESRRRRVFRALVGWGIAAFAVVQVAEPLMHALDLPDWTLKVVVAFLGLGFPVTAVLAWIFDITDRGIVRTASADPSPGSPPAGGDLRVPALLVGLGLLAAAPGFVYYFVWPGGEPAKAAGPAGARSTQGPPSIAVLPFTDMSPGKDQEYFTDGVSEEILNSLAGVDGLRVIGRTSSFSFKGKNATLSEIGRALRASALLQGSVRKEGGRVRISAQLVRAGDEAQIWSQTFDRELVGVLSVQEEIARAVVDALKVRLLPEGRGARTERRPPAPEVYEQYLLGRDYMRRGASERNVRLSAEAFQKALALDAGYAPAWAGYARALAFLADHAPTAAAARDVKRRALEAADRAIAIDPALADGYAERAFVRDLDIAGAQADIEKALALSPGAARTVMGHGGLLLAQGRVEEAVRALQQASEIDPLHAMPLVILAQGQVALGNLAAARAALDRALEIAPENPFAWSGLGTVWLLQGRPEEALAAFQRSPDDVWRLTGEAQARHAMGQTEEARDALTALVERFGHSAAYQIATVFAWRGDRESAFQWLDRAYQQADGGLVDLKTDPMLRSLRGDPRYADLLRKMKLPVD